MSPRQDHSYEGCSCDAQLKELLIENLFEYFELLVLVYQHKLNTFVCLIYDRRYAEDVVQETFVNAYKALLRFSPLEIQALRLRPWLFRIAHNLAQNHRRKDKHVTYISTDLQEGRKLLEEAEGVQYPSPDIEVEWGESRDELYACIQRLPNALKLPVILHYIAELDYLQIAKELQQPLNTVKSNGLRGFHQLQKMMKERVK